jgi:hypothetical protein
MHNKTSSQIHLPQKFKWKLKDMRHNMTNPPKKSKSQINLKNVTSYKFHPWILNKCTHSKVENTTHNNYLVNSSNRKARI